MVQEVAILFENYLWRGNRSTKMSANNFNAFKSNNYPSLAKIGLDIQYHEESLFRTVTKRPLQVHYGMDPNVLFIDLFPGMTESTLRHMLNTPNVKGIVLRTYGAGNAPTSAWFTDAISDALNRGIVIVNVTQCVNGAVDCSLYDTGNTLSRAGVISGHDITSEAAITKLMHLFGMGLPASSVKKYMEYSICGETTI